MLCSEIIAVLKSIQNTQKYTVWAQLWSVKDLQVPKTSTGYFKGLVELGKIFYDLGSLLYAIVY